MTENQINYQKLVEQKRANKAQEQLTAQRDAETQRANVARETENIRANQAREREENRSNVARETENNRSNLARELETNRSNKANEALAKYKADTAAEASKYGADKSYSGRVDSAYINQYGVSPTDAKAGIKAASGVARKVATNPKVVRAAVSSTLVPVVAGKMLIKESAKAIEKGIRSIPTHTPIVNLGRKTQLGGKKK